MIPNAEVDQMVQALHAINDGGDTTCLDGGSAEPVDLYGWARQAAVAELLQNWRESLYDGAPLVSLIEDVDEVIAELKAFKRAVIFRFGLDYPGEKP